MTPARKSSASGAAVPKRRRVRFEFDRVFAMRAAFAVIVVLFLYLILRVSMIAFGGTAAREAKHIERAVEGPVAREPAPAATKAANSPAR